MFKLMFRPMVIVAFVLTLSLIGVNRSDAANITSLWVSAHSDTGDGGDTGASLTTNEDVSFIDWKIKDKEGAVVYSHTSMHDIGTRSVWVNLGSHSGHLGGEKYTCEAVAWFWDEDNVNLVSDSDSYGFRVYRPEEHSGQVNGVYGAAYIYRITYDGSSLGMSGSISGYNTTNQDRQVTGKFRITVFKNGVQVGVPVEEVPPAKEIGNGQSYYESASPSKFIGTIHMGDKYSANAYSRIFVGVPTWKAEGSADFKWVDNP